MQNIQTRKVPSLLALLPDSPPGLWTLFRTISAMLSEILFRDCRSSRSPEYSFARIWTVFEHQIRPAISESQKLGAVLRKLIMYLSEKQFGCLRMPGGAQQRDLPLFHDAPTRRKPSLRTSRNTKHHRTSTREEVVPPYTYAPTTENGTCHSIYPAR